VLLYFLNRQLAYLSVTDLPVDLRLGNLMLICGHSVATDQRYRASVEHGEHKLQAAAKYMIRI
jgi:hypothetical protein